MTTQETIDKIRTNLEEIEDRLKIVSRVDEEVEMILEVVKHHIDHMMDLIRDHDIDEGKYQELLIKQHHQRNLMQKLFPVYFYLNQGITFDSSVVDVRVLP